MTFQKILSIGKMKICTNILWQSKEKPTIIICPNFNLSKSGPFFLLSNVAHKCFDMGYNVFLFDYYANGDSSGVYCDVTLENIQQSFSFVIKYANKCGCKNLYFIGYGLGNLLLHSVVNEEFTNGICMIAPYFSAHRYWKEVLSLAKQDRGFNFYNDEYIWPIIQSKTQEDFWCSILGVTPHLYYEPIIPSFLEDLSHIDLENSMQQFRKKLLLISPQERIPESMLKNNELSVNIISDLKYRTEEQWNEFLNWPIVWDDIAQRVALWFRSFSINNKKEYYDKECSFNDKFDEEIIWNENVIRKSVRIRSQDKYMHGILHLPNYYNKTGTFPCVIYEPGLGGSRVDMGRCAPFLGDELACNNIACFRYDSIGSGVSDGAFYEMTWETRLKNLEDVICQLKQIQQINIDKIVIISYSAGSKVACVAANKFESVRGCILWSPHFLDKSSKNIQAKFKFINSKQMGIPLMGLWLSSDFLKCENKYDFLEEYKKCQKTINIVLGDQWKKDPNISLINSIGNMNGTKKIIEFPGHHCFLYKYLNDIIECTILSVKSIFKDG